MKNQPKESWEEMMESYFGDNERAFHYLKVLKSNNVLNELKQNGLITFEDEMDLGIVGYDAALLVGHARKAYTTGIITEEEAFKVIKFARELTLSSLNSWEEFGKSFIIGFAFDQQHRERSYRKEVYHLYKQVLENPESPWNIISLPNN